MSRLSFVLNCVLSVLILEFLSVVCCLVLSFVLNCVLSVLILEFLSVVSCLV